jgi:tetratricopeptide (TPR) repeat protein
LNSTGSKRLWLFFIALLAVHFVAGYPGFPTAFRQWSWLVGMAGAIMIFSVPGPGARKVSASSTRSSSIPLWFFIGLGSLTFLFRAGRLLSPGTWPCGDEILTAQSVDQIAHHWEGRFFYSFGQSSPLLNWVSAALLKAGVDRSWALWLPPALAAASLPPLAYGVARPFLGIYPAFWFASLLAVGYWPALGGTFALQESLLLPWACLVLACAAAYKTASKTEKKKRAVLLGLTAGSGYWTYIAWIPAALAVVLWFWKESRDGSGKERGSHRGWAVGAFFLALTPYLWFCVREGAGYQFLYLSVFDPHWIGLKERLLSSWDYWNLPFWGSWSVVAGPLDPQGMGLLNPVVAALAVLGAVKIWNARSYRVQMTAAVLLSLVPGLLSRNLQPFRISLFILPALVLAAWGLDHLASTLKEKKRWLFILGTLFFCAVWDGAKLIRARGALASVSLPYRQAALAVTSASKELGPGLLFTQFVARATQAEQALGPMLSSLNWAKPGAPWTRAKWGALIINEHYRPFLEKKLPGVQWKPLAPDMTEHTGWLILGMFPILEKQKEKIGGWIEAQAWLEQRGWEINNISTVSVKNESLENLVHPPEVFRKDRFLTAVHGEWLSDTYYRVDFRRYYDEQIRALRRAVGEGVPAFHLEYELGSLYLRKKHFTEARQAFKAALKSDPGNQDALNALVLLTEMENKTKK